MRETKFTPGPWTADGPDDFGDYNIRHPGDELAVAAVVAEEIAANARLIAAAPDMFEALADIIEQAEKTKLPLGPDLADAIFVLGRAALTKATGEQP